MEGHSIQDIIRMMWDERVAMKKRNPKRSVALYSELYPDNAEQSVDDQKRVVKRWIQKAKKIISNVEQGEFPGDF